MANMGKCVECGRDMMIVSKGLCGRDYARQRKKAGGAPPNGKRGRKKAEGKPILARTMIAQDGSIDFNPHLQLIEELVNLAESLQAKFQKLAKAHKEMRIRFIKTAHKHWLKRFKSADKRMTKVLRKKILEFETQEGAVSEDMPQELILGAEK